MPGRAGISPESTGIGSVANRLRIAKLEHREDDLLLLLRIFIFFQPCHQILGKGQITEARCNSHDGRKHAWVYRSRAVQPLVRSVLGLRLQLLIACPRHRREQLRSKQLVIVGFAWLDRPAELMSAVSEHAMDKAVKNQDARGSNR